MHIMIDTASTHPSKEIVAYQPTTKKHDTESRIQFPAQWPV